MIHYSESTPKGTLVATLFRGELETGTHCFTIPENLAQGLFILEIAQLDATHILKINSYQINKASRFNNQGNLTTRSSADLLTAIDTMLIKKSGFIDKKISIDSYKTTVSAQLSITTTSVMIPSYMPSYWNNDATTKSRNNCYNYSNNKKTNTFAQPGRASGQGYKKLICDSVTNAALRDGLETCTGINQPIPPGKARIALAIAPGSDYHWYREDIDRMWSHKPGKGSATNKDNSSKLISNPEKANRGRYTNFCGYFFVDSDSAQGLGHEKIRLGNSIDKRLYEEESQLKQHNEKLTAKIEITVLFFSGREDPCFYIKEGVVCDSIKTLINKAEKITNYSNETVEPCRVGYRGIMIQYLTDQGTYSDRFIIYNNSIEHTCFDGKSQRTIFMFDSSRSIEKMILDETLAENIIDKDLRNAIDEDR